MEAKHVSSIRKAVSYVETTGSQTGGFQPKCGRETISRGRQMVARRKIKYSGLGSSFYLTLLSPFV